MDEKNKGGPAFPTMNEHQNGPNTYHFEGMTLRDYFAAKAMQEITRSGTLLNNTMVAKMAYNIADAMLEARQK